MYKLLKYFSTLAFSVAAALSQITGEIRGTIADSSGALMEKAKVTVTSVATGESRILESDADGRFAAPLLTIGEYMIKVEKTGFRSAATRAEIQSGAVGQPAAGARGRASQRERHGFRCCHQARFGKRANSGRHRGRKDSGNSGEPKPEYLCADHAWHRSRFGQ